MHDILPGDIAAWQHLERTAADVFSSYGYDEIRVPVLEQTELFTRAIGATTDVVEKEMYTFEDRNGDSLSLRPEGTAGIVRAVLQHGLLYGAPLRLWYRGPMFRHERPQKGRTRQFHQVGAEVFGAPGPDIDAELIFLGERLWRELGLDGLRLEINSLGSAEERAAYREELVRFLSTHQDELDKATRNRAERNPLRVLDSKDQNVQDMLQSAPALNDYLGSESKAMFDGLLEALDRLSVKFEVNPRLVRGLDYYSHSVFEWVSDDLGAQGTVCAGGRYDSLVELQGGKPWPGIGFAMGEERLVELMRQGGAVGGLAPHVYMVLAGARAQLAGMELAEALRNEVPGLRLVCNVGDGSFKSQFRRADRSGALLALVLGDEELTAQQVSLKPLREDRPQDQVAFAALAEWMRGWLALNLDKAGIREHG
jgi:histidyl-tRNA synthetase